jgi:D-psicose/D-tagatose/L-ribulose 3-epimerase
MQRAADVFHALGVECAARDTTLCIEPNPVEYGCDFVTNAPDAMRLVELVDHPGFGLHLDAAGMFMAGDSLSELLPRALPRLCHYHISEPYLSGFVDAQVPHADWLNTLSGAGYSNWRSIEVDGKKHELRHTLQFVQKAFYRP